MNTSFLGTTNGRCGGESHRDTELFDRKQDAVERAREIAQNQRTGLVIHGQDGKILSKESHFHDPFPPKG
ncbi:DUF2188 domain-containing protein [Variovorax paradoxus]|uniref:DUF2188 domain-containing protein n=1 Tax=Variovorax paradoxus TaxID=34073 RepID=UPI00399C3DF6